MPELSPKQKRPTRSRRSPSPTPSTSMAENITVEQLAKSQLETQKQLAALTQSFDTRMKAFTKLVSRATTTRHSELSTDEGEPQQHTDQSDEDYPPPAQPSKGRKVARKRPAQKSVTAAKKRKRMPSPSTEQSADSTTEEEEDLESSPSARKRNARKVVNNLLKAAAPTRSKTAGKHNFYTHKFITRGNSFEKVGLGQATFPEYLAAMKEMVRFPECPKGWAPYITEHEEQLVIMAKKWDWPTCRLWTESVFMFVNRGGVANAWTHTHTILDIQRDVTSTGKRVAVAKEVTASRYDLTKRYSTTYPRAAEAEESSAWSVADASRQGFDKDKDGKPCYAWNWGRDCGFSASHGFSPDARPHICAFCAYKLHKVLPHKEKECLNKQRNADKMQALAILPAKDFH